MTEVAGRAAPRVARLKRRREENMVEIGKGMVQEGKGVEMTYIGWLDLLTYI